MVSELCLGCMTFGRELDEEGSRGIIARYLEAGGNFIDTADVYETGASEEITDLSQSVVDLKLRALMCVSLSVKNRILGVIYVDSRVASRTFKRSDLKFFDALAGSMAITLENARLVAEYVEAERLKESLEIARNIQTGLLPKDPGVLKGFDIAGKLQPIEATAGDYYDFIPLPPNRLVIVAGDVTGHGVGPALLIGLIWDSFLVSQGLTKYQHGQLLPGLAPHWIIALWALFATTLNLSLRWLRSSLWVAALFGAIGGPMAYLAGSKLGSVTFSSTSTAMLALAAGWAIFTPLLVSLAVRLDGFAYQAGMRQGT